jgi:hypothetical protein
LRQCILLSPQFYLLTFFHNFSFTHEKRRSKAEPTFPLPSRSICAPKKLPWRMIFRAFIWWIVAVRSCQNKQKSFQINTTLDECKFDRPAIMYYWIQNTSCLSYVCKLSFFNQATMSSKNIPQVRRFKEFPIFVYLLIECLTIFFHRWLSFVAHVLPVEPTYPA